VTSGGSFRILEGEPIDVYLKSMVPKETPGTAAGTGTPAAAEGAQPADAPTVAGDEDVQTQE